MWHQLVTGHHIEVLLLWLLYVATLHFCRLNYMFLSGHVAVPMLWLASGIKTTWLVLEKHHVKV